MRQKLTRISGFTLIEMAIVLVIIATLMSGFMSLATSYMAGRQNATLNSAVESAKVGAALVAANNKQLALVCVDGPLGCPNVDCASQCSTYPAQYNLGPDEATTHMDPWGMPVRYVQLQASVTSTTAPSLPVFSIVSAGPDGIEGTGDDITRTVTALELLGLVAKMGIGG